MHEPLPRAGRQSGVPQRARGALLRALAAPVLCVARAAEAADGASGCVPIDDVPYAASVDFAADIQPIFSTRCVGCHGANSTYIDLTPANAAINLGWPSTQNPNLARVVPGNPEASLLRGKVQCAVPQAGGPMPPSGSLPAAQIALIYDWILNGAPSAGIDRISYGGFEARSVSAVDAAVRPAGAAGGN